MVQDDVILEEETIHLQEDDEGLTLDDFGPGNFVKNPSVGQTMTFTVLKVSNNLNTKAVNKETNKEFDVGLKDKKGKVRRIDIDTDLGVYTVKNWEIFFKMFGADGVLTRYAKKNNKRFVGARISITRLMDGAHANYKIEDLAKIIDKTIPETKTYQEEVKKAIKESRLFEVKLEE